VSDQVRHQIRDGIAQIVLNRPPSNALTHGVRVDLDEVLAHLIDKKDVRGIVLSGAGQNFCSGADLTEFDREVVDPDISRLCNRIEFSSKPVVAALHGLVLGAGFELALSAHARVAHRKTRIGLPDVTMGLVPGAGATQRLPRILGARAALELLLSGRTVTADDPSLKRLISSLVDDTPLAAAVTMATALADREPPVSRARLQLQKQLVALKRQEAKVRYEIGDVITKLAFQRKRLKLQERLRGLAKSKLDFEVKKYKNGLSTLAFIVRFQREYDQAILAVRRGVEKFASTRLSDSGGTL